MNFAPKYQFTSLTVSHANFPNIGKTVKEVVEPVINDNELFEANQVINYIKGLE